MTETDVAYIAGIIDSSNVAFGCVGNNKEGLLNILVHFFGGKVVERPKSPDRYRFYWVGSEEEFIEFKECIEPHLRITKLKND